MQCTETTIEVIRGDTARTTFNFTDAAGAPLDLAGGTVTWALVLTRGGVPILEVNTTDDPASITITDAAGGVVTLWLTTAETDALTAGSYLYTLHVELPGPPVQEKTAINGASFLVSDPASS